MARLLKLDLLQDLFEKVLIPSQVFNEAVTEGKKNKYPDAILIEKAIDDGWIIVCEIDKQEQLTKIMEFGVHEGEAAAILLAKEKKINEILVDQTHARKAASVFGLKPRGTLYVLFLALKKQLILLEEFLDLCEELITSGFRISSQIYSSMIRKAKKLSQERIH
ncbi:MAG: DUF3368 domain-containing protein [Candidatus Hodarchaeales archaeon]|jgi:predicted nucleic acid-binding protein